MSEGKNTVCKKKKRPVTDLLDLFGIEVIFEENISVEIIEVLQLSPFGVDNKVKFLQNSSD